MPLKEIISQDTIQLRVKELGEKLTQDFAGNSLIVICVLKGAFMFFGELVKHIALDLEIDFVRISSYGNGTVSSEKIVFNKDIEIDIKNKNVLIVEDIVDSGRTIYFLKEMLSKRGPKSIKIATLIDKIARREVNIEADYVGFDLPDIFLVGFGLDYAERFRQLSGIYEYDGE